MASLQTGQFILLGALSARLLLLALMYFGPQTAPNPALTTGKARWFALLTCGFGNIPDSGPSNQRDFLYIFPDADISRKLRKTTKSGLPDGEIQRSGRGFGGKFYPRLGGRRPEDQ